MEACFSALGKVPEERDKFRMAVIGETRKSIKRFSSTVGIASRQQDLFGEEEISSRTSSVVSWRKSARRVEGSATGEGMWEWMGERPTSSAVVSRPKRI
jgi:hypothetical protein